jgi:hypothetical protein
MLELAKVELASFGDRVKFEEVAIGELRPPLRFEAAVSSATMHLVRDELALRGLKACLVPRGFFAYNIWGHSFDETADAPDPTMPVRSAIDAALAERHLPPPEWREPVTPRPRSRAELTHAADAFGFDVEIAIDVDQVPLAFYVEFTAMAPGLLQRLPAEERRAILQRAGELAVGEIPVPSVRVVARKRA